MSDSSIKQQIQEAVKDAMRSKDKEKLSVLRTILAEFKQIEVDKRIELDDTQSLALLDKLEKQRKEAVDQFLQAGRQDLVDKERAEIAIIQTFKPEALSEQEIEKEIKAAIQSSGAAGIKDMGKVMSLLKPKLQGRADMGMVSAKIKTLLA